MCSSSSVLAWTKADLAYMVERPAYLTTRICAAATPIVICRYFSSLACHLCAATAGTAGAGTGTAAGMTSVSAHAG